jgi:predicted dehydrogenase
MAIEGRSDAKKGGRIKLGMVGGGEGAFIGAVHRIASRLDDHYELVAGALSSTPDKARRSGEALGLAADRIYDDYESMAETEAKRSGGIEAVAIVTPNHMHAGPTYAFLKAGVHVICDKPLTVSLAEAKKMQAAVDKSDRIFALTHNYTAYPLVRRMREMAQGGELGEIRLVQVEYPQDWLTGPSETTGNKQAEWRVDPKRSGAGGALGDIGTHAFNLADYVTGLKLAELAADPDHAALRERRARRPLGEPDRAGQRERAQAQGLRDQGRGPLGAGQPERMLWSPFEKSTRIVTRGGPDSGDAAARVMRVPPGHPEGYLEGFANIYSEVALAIKAARAGKKPPKGVHFPTIEDGVKGLAFIEAAVKSSKANAKWVKP